MSEAGQILDQSAPKAPVTETKEVQTQEVKKEEPIASKLSILMQRESQALNRERMAKAQEEKLKERLKKIEEFESIKTDPKKALDMLGLSYDQLTESILKDGEVPPSVHIKQLQDKISDLENRLKLEKDEETEIRKKQVLEAESKAIGDFKTEIGDYLKNNTARYELIDFEGAHDLVFDVIDEHYNRTIDPQSGVGKIMSIQEAADKVEEHLEKKYLAAKEKNKVKAFWLNMPKQIQEQIKKQEVSQPPKTLTNNLGSRVSEKSTRPPEDQRIQKIVAEHVAKMRQQYAG